MSRTRKQMVIKLGTASALSLKQRILLFIEGRLSNPYKINTYGGTRWSSQKGQL